MDLFVLGLKGANYILKPFADAVTNAGRDGRTAAFMAGQTTPVIWHAKDSLVKAGYVVDSAALKGMHTGFLTTNFSSRHGLDSFNRSMFDLGFKERQLTGVPVFKDLPYKKGDGSSSKALGDKNNTSGSLSDTGAAVIGGGARQIVMNFHAPLYRVDKQEFKSVREHVQDMEGTVKEAMWRILKGVPA